MRFRQSIAFVASMLLFITALSTPIGAADLGAAPAAPAESAASIDDYLAKLTVLYQIRAHFGVISFDDVGERLDESVRALGPDGPAAPAMDRLDRDLLAEGSYYVVSLLYLIQAGGAAWPEDRPASSYANDALVQLDQLQDALIDATARGEDPLAVLEGVNLINAWTEGFATIPPHLDSFADRDALAAAALAGYDARAAT